MRSLLLFRTFLIAFTHAPTRGWSGEIPSGFAADLMLKDLRLSQDAAAESGAETPIGATATALYEAFVEDGGAGQDFSAVLPYLERK